MAHLLGIFFTPSSSQFIIQGILILLVVAQWWGRLEKKEERGSSRSIDKHRPASFESGVNLSSRFFYVQLKLIASSSHISVSVFIYGGMSYKGSSVDVHRLPCSNWLLCFVMPPIIFNLKVFFATF